MMRHCFAFSQLNAWIGWLFVLGATHFVVASLLILFPGLAEEWSVNTVGVNASYFAGSIPFTVAAYLQLFQAANQPPMEHETQSNREGRRVLFGWQPDDAGWLSCALQFVGTLCFNLNTFDAMMPSLTFIEYDVMVWVPNVVGSLLFLASGYLAFIEVCHRFWDWHPSSLSWWVVFVNLLGCIAFLFSSFCAILLPGITGAQLETLAVIFTLVGACCFLQSSMMMLVESALGAHHPEPQETGPNEEVLD